VAAERSASTLDQVLPDDADVAIAAITAAELLEGVEHATGRRRSDRSAYVNRILETVAIEDYDLAVARHHARLLATTRRAGRPRGPHDLIVAATAAATDRAVLTLDLTAFDQLPGVRVARSSDTR
jgi:tRNA(fMet)-specific endonuclease VapC